MNNVLVMRPGWGKIMEKVHVSRNFESPETDLQIEENTCCIDYADTWSSKPVHWLSKGQCSHRGTTYYGGEDTLEFDTGVARASLPILSIHLPVAPKSTIQWSLATLHNTGSMDYCQVRHGSCDAIPLLDPVHFEEAYSHIASHYHSPQWHIR